MVSLLDRLIYLCRYCPAEDIRIAHQREKVLAEHRRVQDLYERERARAEKAEAALKHHREKHHERRIEP